MGIRAVFQCQKLLVSLVTVLTIYIFIYNILGKAIIPYRNPDLIDFFS